MEDGCLCSSKLTSGGVQCTKLRSGLRDHNVSGDWSCDNNYTHNLPSVTEVKQIIPGHEYCLIDPTDVSVRQTPCSHIVVLEVRSIFNG